MAETRWHMLSTKDNPYNPHTEFDDWWAWDTRAGYNSLALLARVVKTSNDLPEALQDQAVEDAIDEIVRENVSGMHIKVPNPED